MTTPLVGAVVSVETHGKVAPADIAYARTRIGAVLHYAPIPVLHARIKLTRLPNPAQPRRALVQANLDLNGRLVRAQVARPTMREAIDEVHDRIRDRLQRAAGHWEAIRGSRPIDNEWRHNSRRTRRALFFPRLKDDRQIVRHKSFSLARTTVDDAAYEMARLDYDFHLFTESGSGVDGVLYRTEDGSFRLSQLDPHPGRVAPSFTPVEVDTQPAPRLTTGQAIARLDATDAPFVFFRDGETGRAQLLYHRYDGHYGAITPAD